MGKVRRYAEGTQVSVEKSRDEIEKLLEKHGAAEVAVHRDAERSTIVFRMRERLVKLVIEVPRSADYKIDESAWRARPDSVVANMVAAELRRRWRHEGPRRRTRGQPHTDAACG